MKLPARWLLLTVLVTGTLVAMFHSALSSAEPGKETPRMLRHVVLFKFKTETTPEQIKQVEDAFRGLPAKIPEIRGFEWGTDVSVENKSHGFTHCFYVTFADEKGRETYLPHAAHQAFVSIVKPHLDDVCVVDYWSGS